MPRPALEFTLLILLFASSSIVCYPSGIVNEHNGKHHSSDESHYGPDRLSVESEKVTSFSAGGSHSSAAAARDDLAAVHAVLERVPLIDGHNDLPFSIRHLNLTLSLFNLTDLSDSEPWNASLYRQTDIRKLRQGKLGAQFWVAYTDCRSQHVDSPQKTFEQIDLIHRLVRLYSDTFETATTAKEIEVAFGRGKIASLIGVEGGHSIGNSLSVLRSFYQLGVRYMTLTHACPTPWADNSQLDNPGQQAINNGLSAFGEMVVLEMNRLGMMVDISHVSVATMKHVLNVTRSPVIFSHSGAFAVCNNTRNVPDDVLRLLASNGGIIMVVFMNGFVSCRPTADVKDVVRHIQHIRNVIGVDYIGIGSDFNGVKEVPKGLEDVSKYPQLFVELLHQGWTEGELEKLAGKNVLRVMRQVEQVKEDLSYMEPIDEWIAADELDANEDRCISVY